VTTYEVRLPDQTVVKVMEKIDPAADSQVYWESSMLSDRLQQSPGRP
jgi:hypothetical protein